MFFDDNNRNLGDSGEIAEELLAGLPELRNKCAVIQKTVEDEDFSLEEALTLYGVSQTQYKSFLLLKFFEEIEELVVALVIVDGGHPKDPKSHYLKTIDILEESYKKLVAPRDQKSKIVLDHWAELHKSVKDTSVPWYKSSEIPSKGVNKSSRVKKNK
ncbi:MAG: hypothetical protein ABW007_02350 [Chitinophagaceae bacterium]